MSLSERYAVALKVMMAQLQDPRLWMKPVTAREALMLSALMALHSAIKGDDAAWKRDSEP